MQWDAHRARRLHDRHAVAGRSTRTTPRSTPRPQRADPDSVFHHYRRLIELRHTEPAVAHGDFTMLLEEDERVYAFTRRHEDIELLVLGNFSGDEVPVDLTGWEDAELLIGEPRRGAAAVGGPRLLPVIAEAAGLAGVLEQLRPDVEHEAEGDDDEHEADDRRRPCEATIRQIAAATSGSQ